jgi:hypothetical protein
MVEAWIFLNKLDDFLLLFIALLLMAILGRWQLTKDNPFDIQNVFVDEHGKASLFKIGQAIAMIVSTWVLINETRAGRLTEFLFTAYMVAWAGSNLTSKAIDAKAKKDSDENLK